MVVGIQIMVEFIVGISDRNVISVFQRMLLFRLVIQKVKLFSVFCVSVMVMVFFIVVWVIVVNLVNKCCFIQFDNGRDLRINSIR